MQTILITGGGRGLGRATAERLASLGHRVVFTARNAQSGGQAEEEIRTRVPGGRVEARVLDLASLEAVRAFGQSLAAEGLALDALVNCAGVMQQSPVRRLTVDGLEQTLAVNAMAPFLLTSTLMPALRRTPAARVVNVSSRMHMPGSRGRPVDFDFQDPQLERGYNPDRAYKNSKLALLWFTFELQRRLQGTTISCNAVCPGFVPVTAAQSIHGFQRWLLRRVLVHLPFARSVAEAVDSLCFMAVDPSLRGLGGGFYGEQKRIAASTEAQDQAKARQFWDLAAAATASGPWPS